MLNGEYWPTNVTLPSSLVTAVGAGALMVTPLNMGLTTSTMSGRTVQNCSSASWNSLSFTASKRKYL